jgi:hypothetical protein
MQIPYTRYPAMTPQSAAPDSNPMRRLLIIVGQHFQPQEVSESSIMFIQCEVKPLPHAEYGNAELSASRKGTTVHMHRRPSLKPNIG